MSNKRTNEESLLPPLWVIVLFSLYGMWWLLSALKELVMLLIIGYAFAFVLDPIIDSLERKKISRPIGFFLVINTFVLLTVIFLAVALPPFLTEVENFLSNIPHYIQVVIGRIEQLVSKINTYLEPAQQISLNRADLMHYGAAIDATMIKNGASALFRFLLEGYSITMTLLNLALLPFFIYYLAVDIDQFHRWCIGLVPKRLRKTARSMFQEIHGYLRAFIVGQTTVSIILTILYSLGFAIAGHSQWILIGVVTGIGNLVPYFGTVLGILLSVTFSLTSDEPTSMIVKTAIVFGIVQFLEGTFITPKVVGEKVGLSPLLVILAILVGGKLFGLLGIFLAVPGAAAIRVIGGYTHRALLVKAGEG